MTAPKTPTPAGESLLPATVGSMSIGDLRAALLASPDAAGPLTSYAAVDILVTAFGGLLLAVDEVRECVSVDDGKARVDWKRLDKFGRDVHGGYSKAYPIAVPGAGIALQVASALATGEVTPSTARTLAGALAVAGRRQRPADRK